MSKASALEEGAGGARCAEAGLWCTYQARQGKPMLSKSLLSEEAIPPADAAPNSQREVWSILALT